MSFDTRLLKHASPGARRSGLLPPAAASRSRPPLPRQRRHLASLGVKLRHRFDPVHRVPLRARVQLSNLPGNSASNHWRARVGHEQAQLPYALCATPFTHRSHSFGCFGHTAPHCNALQRNALRAPDQVYAQGSADAVSLRRHSSRAADAQRKMPALTQPSAVGRAFGPRRSISAPTTGGPRIVPTP